MWGHLGDRIGRQKILAATIVLMGAATALIGVLPTYQKIGLLAPALLFACRVAQGLFASGESAGALSFMLEHSPGPRRGFWLGAVSACSVIASALGALAVYVIQSVWGNDAYLEWAWRIPFLFGGLIMIVGIYIRRALSDGPAFTAVVKADRVARVPLKECVRKHPKQMLTVFMQKTLQSLAEYTLLAYFPIYLQTSVGMPAKDALVVNGIALVALTVEMPLFAALSDRIGRRPVILGGSIAVAVAAVPAYMLASQGGMVYALVGQLLWTVPAAAIAAGGASLTVEIFPTRVRYTGGTVSYNLGYAVFGGTAPLVGELLVSRTGSPVSPAFYLLGLAVIVVPVLWKLLPETYRLPMLRDDDLVEAEPSVAN
jgi:MHS family proline/betaine transporter-like MFS transporter